MFSYNRNCQHSRLGNIDDLLSIACFEPLKLTLGLHILVCLLTKEISLYLEVVYRVCSRLNALCISESGYFCFIAFSFPENGIKIES